MLLPESDPTSPTAFAHMGASGFGGNGSGPEASAQAGWFGLVPTLYQSGWTVLNNIPGALYSAHELFGFATSLQSAARSYVTPRALSHRKVAGKTKTVRIPLRIRLIISASYVAP